MRKTKSTYKRLLSVLLCLVMIMALAPMSVFAADEAQYTVNYHISRPDGMVNGSLTLYGVVGSSVCAPNEISGFPGYHLDEYASGIVNAEGTLVIEAYYKADPVQYVEKIYVNGDLVNTLYFSAPVGSVVSASTKEYAGYVLDEANSVTSVVVNADGTAAIILWFVSNQPKTCNITFSYVGLGEDISAALPYGGSTTGVVGQEFTLPEAPSFTGYKFDGWLANGKSVSGHFTLDASSVEIKGVYSLSGQTFPYTVNYYFENLNGGYTKQSKVAYSPIGTVTAAEEKFDGFDYMPGMSNNTAMVSDSGSTEMNLYYSRKRFNITYMVDGKQSGSPVSYKYGEKVNVNATPTKKNYTFVGWNFTPALGSGNTMPASDVVISGEFTQANTTYTVITYRQNTKGAYDVYSTVKVAGNAGDKTTVKAAAVDGYKARTVVNKTIAEDGSTVIKVYYDIVSNGTMRPLEDVKEPEPTEKPVDDPYADLPPILNDNGEVIGYETEDGDVYVTEDGTAVSVEDPEVADIAEEDTPLAAGVTENSSNISIILYIIIGTCLVLAAAIVYFKNKKLYNV